jgi:hypothetical protein
VYQRWLFHVDFADRTIVFLDTHVFLRGPEDELKRLRSWQDRRNVTGPLHEWLTRAAEKHALVAAWNPRTIAHAWNVWTREVASGQVPPTDVPDDVPLPREAQPFAPLLRAQSAGLVVDVDNAVQAEARLTFPDAKRATEAEPTVRRALRAVRAQVEQSSREYEGSPEMERGIRPILQQAEDALKSATTRTEGTSITVTARLRIETARYAAASAALSERALQMQSAGHLRQLVLAMVRFSDASHGILPPPAILNKEGKPLLSWRVAILPYLGEDALYREFHLDEPWDSERNKKLLPRMPKAYAPVKHRPAEPYTTYYQVFVGPSSVFEIRPGNQPFGAYGRRFPAEFFDGVSNTILIVEAGEAVPWTKPADIPFDPKKAVPRLGGEFGFAFHAGIGDGSAALIRTSIDQGLLKQLIMPSDLMDFSWEKVPEIEGWSR